MVYLEYDTTYKQVVEIHEKEPTTSSGYDYAISTKFKAGDEFETTIWINSVDSEKNLTSYSAIRNNPNAQRLLKENQMLKEQLEATKEALDFLLMGGM